MDNDWRICGRVNNKVAPCSDQMTQTGAIEGNYAAHLTKRKFLKALTSFAFTVPFSLSAEPERPVTSGVAGDFDQV
jgi:hypothetical protein